MSLMHLAVATICAAVALSVIMALAWKIQQASGKTGSIDAFWTFGTGGSAFILALAAGDFAHFPHWRQITVAVLAGIWSLRLGLHIVQRARHSGDDPRYRRLTEGWASGAPRRMFRFLQMQAAVGTILVVSIVLAAANANPKLRIQDCVGTLILASAIVGEAVADAQLRRFKAEAANRFLVCDVGLWKLSRHPNYFFEWLAWIAYPVIAIDFAGLNPHGWLAVSAPAVMYWALVHVSGIPPLEAHMLERRGEAFRAYQRRARAFFPLPISSKK
jgi:steroid 5-alpha reductase family enzyme